MDYIDHLRKQNITFHNISEEDALVVMRKQYSYYRLLEYSSLFEKYRATSKKGTFVALDFIQLYCLALIDSRLSQILMNMCLEIENSIKVWLLQEVDDLDGTKAFLSEYYKSDKAYIDKTYTSENIDFLQEIGSGFSIEALQLHEFLNLVQFGTLEKMIHFLNESYSDKKELFPYEGQLHSVRRIRNIVAHNNAVISRLSVPARYMNLEIRAYLGARGIKNKTLQTNMSKEIVSDLVNVLYLFFHIVSDKEPVLKELREFDADYCQKYEKRFRGNTQLRSVYMFLKAVIEILSNG